MFFPKIKDGFSGERACVLPPAAIEIVETHPLAVSLHITDIGYYPKASGHYRERTVPLRQHVLIYCLSGTGWYEAGGNHYDVGPDSYFVLPPGTPHRYGASTDDPWTIYWVHFKGELANEYFSTLSSPVEIKPDIDSRIADRINLFEEIMAILEKGFSRENLLYACSLFHHFLGTLRFLQQYRSQQRKTSSPDGIADTVGAAIHFMNENIGKSLRLDDIASFAGYSKSRFSDIFTRHTGMPPMEYLNMLRIKYACRLLDFSDLKICQICHKAGIADPYYFSRLFKKEMGMSPLAYRRKEKG